MATEGIMTAANATANAEAIDWHLRQADLDEAGWTAFVAWLESPANALAYDRVAAADRLLDEAERPVLPAVAPVPA